jgi:PAS domain S-box-containing protein
MRDDRQENRPFQSWRPPPGDDGVRYTSGATDVPIASILLVDDHRPNLLALEAVLGSLRQRLVTAQSGEEALEHLGREEFALILLDVRMRGLDGFQTAARIRDLEQARHTPIIFISGLPEDMNLLYQGYEQGAVDYVSKPFNPDILRAKVSVFVELHRKTEQVKRQAASLRKMEREANDEALRLILDSSLMGLLFSDFEGRVLDVNNAFLSMLGYTREDLEAGRIDWAALTPPEYVDADEKAVRELNERGRATQYEKDYIHKNGSRVAVVIGCARVEKQNRNLTYVLDISERKRAEANMRFLAEAGELLSSSLEFRETLRQLAQLVVPLLADWCAIDIKGPGGSLQRVAVQHTDPAKMALALEIERRYPPDPRAATGVPNVLRTGETEWAADISDEMLASVAVDSEHLRLARELGLRSFIIVPLTAGGRVIGALTLVHAESGRRYTGADVQVAEDLARRAALSVDNALLFEREQHTRARLDAIFALVPAVVGVIQASDLRYVLANLGLRRLFGDRPLVGKTVIEAHPDLVGQSFFERVEEVVQTGEAYVGNEVHLRVDPGHDGQAVEEFFNIVLQPMQSSSGDVESVLLFAVEVTDQVRARRDVELLAAELQHSEEQFRLLAETMPQLVWTTNPAGYYEYFNQRWYDYTGLTTEQSVGEGWRTVLHPDEIEHTLESWARSLRTAEPYEIQYRLRRGRDGAYRWFLGRALAARDAAGRIVRWFGTCTDIDDQKRAEEERQQLVVALERSNKELDQFAYVTSHDLKAPLRGIANLSQWIEEDLADKMTEESTKQMTMLRGRVHRLESLIDGILRYSRAGRGREKPETIDVGKLLRELVELLAPPANARVEIAADMPTLQSERASLQQTFLNLIGNALKHAGRDDPHVQIGVRDAGAFWEFSVTDNGEGIAPEYHERIWGLFQTLKPRDLVEGTGIGLSVVRRIAQSKGCRAWVESTPGTGATFRFTWPKVPEPPRSA